MMTKFLPLFIFLLLCYSGSIIAQDTNLVATIEVIEDSLSFQRVDVSQVSTLPATASALLGVGDRIQTSDIGRVLISLDASRHILLLPNSSYEIVAFAIDETETLQLHAILDGIAVHDFGDAATSFNYQLETENFNLTTDNAHFAVWALSDDLQVVNTISGDVIFQTSNETPLSIPAHSGFAMSYSPTPVSLTAPFHAVQVIEASVNCSGTVVNNDTQGVRLRQGAAFDYLVLDTLDDVERVAVVGVTENGRWYRVPMTSNFAWLAAGLLELDCPDLPQFPNLIGEQLELIRRVSPAELILLEPFYGTPEMNMIFYP